MIRKPQQVGVQVCIMARPIDALERGAIGKAALVVSNIRSRSQAQGG